ncbi:MAG TPA: sensor domain-containing diguanylate cyclase [Stellaceae bacterium]|nr:sensor domain-containing diguanylate cyclase [Stellaceae bacterium]
MVPAHLDSFGGAAMIVDRAGGIVPQNAAATELLPTFNPMQLSELAAVARRVSDTRGVETKRLSAFALDPLINVMVLPLADADRVLVLAEAHPAEAALRSALVESRQRYRDLVEASSDFVWETDRLGRFVFISTDGALGYDTRVLIGRQATDFLVDASPTPLRVFDAHEPVLQVDVWLQCADGQISCQSITAVPVCDQDDVWCGARGMARDVTEARNSERHQRQRHLSDRLLTYLRDTIRNEIQPEKTLPAALSGTGLAIGADGGLILNGDPSVIRVLPDLAAMDSAEDDIVCWGEPLPAEDLAEVQAALAEQGSVDLMRSDLQVIGHVTEYAGDGRSRLNGAVVFWRRLDAGGFGDGDRAVLSEVAGQIGVALAQLGHHRQIVTLSNTDGLTGLLNRRAFFAELQRRLSRLAQSAVPAALVYADINNLKSLNDLAGHVAGDQAILMLADLLRAGTRSGDLIARIGGDEFVLWLEGVGDGSVEARARLLLRQTAGLRVLTVAPERPVGVSLGLAVYDPARPEALDRLVARADQAMYRAKHTPDLDFAIADDTEPLDSLEASSPSAVADMHESLVTS